MTLRSKKNKLDLENSFCFFVCLFVCFFFENIFGFLICKMDFFLSSNKIFHDISLELG